MAWTYTDAAIQIHVSVNVESNSISNFLNWYGEMQCVLFFAACISFIQTIYFLTLLLSGPRREDFASGAWYDSHKPVATCMMKQTESPYLISATPIPSMSRFGPDSTFSCKEDGRKK